MCGVDWEALRPLPDVAPRYRNRRSRTWEHRRDVYAELPKTPIVITAELGTPIIHAEHPLTHLDSILVFAAFITHPVESVHDGSEPPVVPLPLELTWVSSAGLPLWACTPLAPLESSTDSREYWHKRYPAHRAEFGSRLNANLTGGRWREYRMPVRAHAVRRLGALAIGNAPEVERLLSVITHIGKKGSMGYGRVLRWTVTESDHTLDDVLMRRPVPIAFFEGKQPRGRVELRRAWTPPYWYAPRWTDCVVPPGEAA